MTPDQILAAVGSDLLARAMAHQIALQLLNTEMKRMEVEVQRKLGEAQKQEPADALPVG